MTFEEYKNKMDQLTEMQCKSNDQTILQRIRDEMEEKYPELAEQYRNWLWEQLEKEKENENQYHEPNQVRRNLESVIRRIRYK